MPGTINKAYIYPLKRAMSMETVLITGGNGLIGKYLAIKLRSGGYHVITLSRSAGKNNGKDQFFWDSDKNIIDPGAITPADYIIHLAGANIGDKRWTKQRKQEIIDSRVKSTQLIFNAVQAQPNHLKAFISASATGYYGAVTTEKVFSESDLPASDFLGETCRRWEEAAHQFENASVRTVIIRTGVVLTPKGGALGKMTPLVRLGLGSPLGSGNQYLPWIHIDDLCEIYIRALKDQSMTGAFNAAAPDNPTNKEFYRILARLMKKPLWLPAVPSIVLKIALGKMSAMLLEGSRVSSEKIRTAGYHFRFPELEGALRALINKE
jgi:uncharacterized protein